MNISTTRRFRFLTGEFLYTTLLCISVLLAASPVLAASPDDNLDESQDILDPSSGLEGLIDIDAMQEDEEEIRTELRSLVTIASKKAMTVQETPGIVTVITKKDILDSGARDLMEVLNVYVPSIGFGADVEGVVGISMHGMWAHEGKLLLMIDGLECNEDMFATTQFGNHYPIENIERIEIIRGPGSAIYGGYAGVGVINIITKGPEQNASWASVLYSRMKKTHSHRNLALGYGRRQAIRRSASAVSSRTVLEATGIWSMRSEALCR